MNKQEFLSELRKGLSGLPQEEIEERLIFYSEMIDDKVEDGLSQEEAVSEIGDATAIVSQITAEAPLTKLIRKKIKPKRSLGAWGIILIILGSPVWLSVLIAVFAVIFSLYISLWAVIISLWAVFALFIVCALGGIIGGIVFTTGGNGASGLAMLAAGIVCAGLSIFMFYGCKAATRGTLLLTKKMAIWIKNCFRGKEEA